MKGNGRFLRITTLLFVASFVISSFVGCSKKEVKVEMKRDKMIVAKLEQAEKYFDLHPDFEKVFAFLRQENLTDLPIGRHELDGDRVFCTIAKDKGRKREGSELEAHRKYIDIQYIISGDEEMGWKPTEECKMVSVEYDADKDIGFFKDEPSAWNKVPPGSFTIFFPQDAHTPLIGDGEIYKVVAKIMVK